MNDPASNRPDSSNPASSNPELRAGDADRDRTIAELREAYAEGRLTADEFADRLTRAQAARTFGDLELLTRDLPPLTAASTEKAVVASAERTRGLRQAWGAWLGVGILVNVIWGATWITNPGDAPYYWPIWVWGPWGAAMLLAQLTGKAGSRG